jgi:hypothetical protein
LWQNTTCHLLLLIILLSCVLNVFLTAKLHQNLPASVPSAHKLLREQ